MVTARNFTDMTVRIRFYGSLEAGLAAWAAVAVAIGVTFGVDHLPLFVVTLGGMLAILGGAMRHPAYRQLKSQS